MASFLFSTQKGVPGTKSMGRLVVGKRCRILGSLKCVFLAFFKNPTKNQTVTKNTHHHAIHDKASYTRKILLKNRLFTEIL